ncbi:MAG: HAMP domain-containing sensor histidine kinase [Acidobacteria bacterium]|nr:HAMP domain-containing sensor histidine kinase [Acidobacteriota bacterium]
MWQILLIVPPVVILSVTALYSLRQDRASIEQDARRNAAVLATDLARRWGARAESQLAALVASACSGGDIEAQAPPADAGDGGPLCGLVVDGRIRVPLDYLSALSPPDWLRDLTPSQARAWRVVADVPADVDLATLRRAVASLAGASSAARVNAEWILVRAEVNRDTLSKATERLLDLANRSAGIASESGTPLSDLALLLALRHLRVGGMPDVLLQDLRRRIVEHPSLLTKLILEDATRVAAGNMTMAGINRRWAANELALDLLRQLRIDAVRPTAAWIETGNGAWLALIHPLVAIDEGTAVPRRSAYQITLVSARRLERVFQAAASDRDDVPKYAAATIRLEDHAWRVGRAMPATEHPVELASASGQIALPLAVPSDAVSTFAGELFRIAPQAIPLRSQAPGGAVRLSGVPGGHAFTVILELADANALYASYRVRLWMAIGLVFTATLAAFGGLVGAWRAFERQRRLGEMKSNFVASVSHELRAPIASVTLMAESLERGTIEPGERRQEYLRVIGQECRRLSSLVENLLDFSRIDRGRRQYSFEPADLPALVVQTADVMRPYAAQRHVSLVCQTATDDAEPPQMSVDREALQQALVNLVDNAIKHSPAGADVLLGLEVDADEATSDTRRPVRVRLFVTDHGPGIPADEQTRIFEPFYRRGSELRRETQGIGIGLSIVKHVAEAHGGRVVVRSSPGSGSRFTIELPVPAEPAS